MWATRCRRYLWVQSKTSSAQCTVHPLLIDLICFVRVLVQVRIECSYHVSVSTLNLIFHMHSMQYEYTNLYLKYSLFLACLLSRVSVAGLARRSCRRRLAAYRSPGSRRVSGRSPRRSSFSRSPSALHLAFSSVRLDPEWERKYKIIRVYCICLVQYFATSDFTLSTGPWFVPDITSCEMDSKLNETSHWYLNTQF